MAYLNCPECFYRVRTAVADDLDGEASCPRCARLGRLVSMFSTQIALRPTAEDEMVGAGGLADPSELNIASPGEDAASA